MTDHAPPPEASEPTADALFEAGSESRAEARVRAELEGELSKHLLGGRRTSDIGQTVLAAITVFIFWDVVSTPIVLSWFGALVAFSVARAAWRSRVAPTLTDPMKLRVALRHDVWVSAALWGVWAVLLIGAPVTSLAILLIIIAGLLAAATSTLVADPPSFDGFMGLLIGSATVTVLASGHSREHFALLLLIALFLPFMLSVHRRAHAILVGQIASQSRLRISDEETARGRNFLNALVAHAPSPIVVLDRESRVLRANPAFERVTGRSWGEVHGQPLPSLLAGPEEAPALESFLETIKVGARSVAELRLVRKAGVPMWMRLSGTVAGGLAEGTVILIGEDVTDQVEAREAREAARLEAEQVARAKSAFLASMSHEIRTPMNGVLGMIELLLDTELSEEQRSTVDVIQASADGLLRILNDVLDVSKIEAGQMDLEAIDFELPALLNAAARVFAPQSGTKGIELVVDVADDVPRSARGDPVRLRQILSNLLSNAVKFTTEGEIVLSARVVGKDDGATRVLFAVRDTGIGIAEEKHERVFGEFEQADSSTTRVHGGTGLGLTISRRLVELMGGRLSLTSREGEGSEFHFVLTLKHAVESRSAGRRIAAVPLNGHRVLVLDDNATARRISREALAHEGAIVREAADVEEALALMRDARRDGEYDAVVLDHLMPRRDGFDFARALREDEELGPVRMLMLTSSAAATDKEAARQLGIGGYLAKPVAKTDLVRAVSTLLGQEAHGGPERRLITTETLVRRSAPVRILLAEDNAVNQQVALALLTKQGYSVDVVDNGRKALEAVLAEPYDVILMDIQMPEMDGLEATRQIRSHEEHAELPIIALTAHAFQEERDRTVEAGMDDFLAKPFKPAALYEIVERWAPNGEGTERRTAQDEEGEMSEDDGAPAVDVEAFRESMRAAGIEEIVDTTLDIYRGEAPMLFAKIRDAVERGDAEAIRTAAHSLKSSSGNVRATRLAELLQGLEDAGRGGDTEAASRLYAEVRAAYEAVMEQLGR
jgi:two-component system, sensor histidine kinase and response regulator